MGYFRDVQALYELLLDETQQKKLDEMWQEMDFDASVTSRTYVQFAHNPDRPAIADTNVAADDAPPVMLTEEKQITAQDRIMALKADFLQQASTTPPPGGGRRGGRGGQAAPAAQAAANAAAPTGTPQAAAIATVQPPQTAAVAAATAAAPAPVAPPARGGRGPSESVVTPDGIQAVKNYFDTMNSTLRWVEKARVAAEPSHLQALFDFASRAYRRPLTKDDRDELLAYYKAAREKDGLDHEAAIRDSIVAVLMSPDFFYRVDLVGGTQDITPISDTDLASRLSYFLWSSIPDAELTAHAAKGDLHNPKVIAAQAKRMLADARVRALAVEFGGNWLDFRRFESLNTVDRERFDDFTNELRTAMFEEPVHFLSDVFQRNRPVLDLLYGRDTFVNAPLAKHYGIQLATLPASTNEWVHVEDATPYQRGGLLPMAVFLTKNAPGLRTSPVKRGNWVVKNILGERIPPPPPNVPTLPQDETKLDLPLRDMLARHRENAACATCHERFDALGLVFEGFGPTGERRVADLAGRAVDARATFPRNGGEGAGLPGLQHYIRDHRQDDFVNNFCSKLVAYALGRSLIPSDDELIAAMQGKLAADGWRIDSAIETLVTSPQFLRKRARSDLAQN
jgi:hypothetical protein